MNDSTATKKRCTRCKIYRDVPDFYRKPNGALRAECKHCLMERNVPKDDVERERRSAYGRAWRRENLASYNAQRAVYRETNRDRIRARHQEWHALFPERKLLFAARSRAKKSGIECTIELSDLLPLPTHCPVFGFALRKGVESCDPHAYSIDRVDNSKGYVPGNVAVISRQANVLKRDSTLAELRQLVRWLEQQTVG